MHPTLQKLIHLVIIHKKTAIAVAIALLMLLIFTWPSERQVSEIPSQKSVRLIHITDAQDPITITSLAEVRSLAQAQLRSLVSGRVNRLAVTKGQTVTAGQLIAELDHAAADGQIQSAQAAVDIAISNLEKIRSGARSEDRSILSLRLQSEEQRLREMKKGAREEEVAITQSQLENAGQGLELSKNLLGTARLQVQTDNLTAIVSATNTFTSAKNTLETVLSSRLQDVLFPGYFLRARTAQCVYRLRAESSAAKLDLEAVCRTAVNAYQGLPTTLTTPSTWGETIQRVQQLQTALTLSRTLLDTAVDTLTTGLHMEDATGYGISDEVYQSYLQAATLGRSEIELAMAQVTTSLQLTQTQALVGTTKIDMAQKAVNDAQNAVVNLEQKLTIQTSGATKEQIAIQENAVEQARLLLDIAQKGARSEEVRAAQAQVELTSGQLDSAIAQQSNALITAPFDGTVIELPIKVGETVTTGQVTVEVANPSVLELQFFLNEADTKLVHIGNEVRTATTLSMPIGLITSIAPALDRATKKTEVIATVTGETDSFTIGQTLSVFISATPSNKLHRLPMAAVRLEEKNAFVFTVQNGTLVSIPVELGNPLNDTVELLSGVNPNLTIVADARGLREGESVLVTEP